jgi:hypothetical protein
LASPLKELKRLNISNYTLEGIVLGEQTAFAPFAFKSFFVLLSKNSQTDDFPQIAFSTPALSERGSSLKIFYQQKILRILTQIARMSELRS